MPPLPNVLSSLPACPAAEAVTTIRIAQQCNTAYFLKKFGFMLISCLTASAVDSAGLRCFWRGTPCRVALVRASLRILASLRALATTLDPHRTAVVTDLS